MQENKKQPKPKPGLKRTISLPSAQETAAIEGIVKRLLGTNLDFPDRNNQLDLKLAQKNDQPDLNQRLQKNDEPFSSATLAAPANQTIQALPLAAPANQTAPATQASPANQTGLYNPLSSDILAGLNLVAGYLQLPNTILDSLCSLLSPDETVVYLQLYRLSHGFNNSFCSVSLPTLSKRTNISERTIYRVLNSLERKSLIKRDGHTFGKGKEQGNVFRVTAIPSPAKLAAPAPLADIKEDDDPLKKQDHHQGQQSEHENQTMTIYQNITQNSWTKADAATYQKIKNIPIEAIETAIKLATQRASSRPNSLAFFTKEILSVASPKQNRSKQKKLMEKVVERVRNSFIGSNYSMSDFVYKVKEFCLRDDVAFDNNLLDEILAKKHT